MKWREYIDYLDIDCRKSLTLFTDKIACTVRIMVVVLPVPGGPSTSTTPDKPGRERDVTTPI